MTDLIYWAVTAAACGDCDCGDNDEAIRARAECDERQGPWPTGDTVEIPQSDAIV